MQSDQASVFPVALNLRGRSVLVIGGNQEATEKVPKLLATGANVAIVALSLSDELARLVRTTGTRWYARGLCDHDVQGAHLVVLCEQDAELAERLRRLRARDRFWLCAIDQPKYGDVYLVSSVRSGPLLVSISSGGQAPLLARRIRQSLERAFDGEFGEFARRFASLRRRLRALPRGERSQRLAQALEGFAMEVRVRYPAEDGQGADDPSDEARERARLARRD